MADHTGQQLGNYRLVRHLGDGAFADVYLGEHVYLKSYAALKVLHKILNEEDVERFLAEAQTLVALRHPNIVRVLEFIFEQGTPMLVMDYAQGGTARQRFPSESRLPLTTVTVYIKQIADALQYAHNHSIIHRDVKPENILFDTDQQILLSDFGLALLAPSPELLSIHEWAGTISYMAPEQIQKKPTFASDQYALGIITYEWLCGVRPFVGGPGAIINQHLFETPPSLREKRPDVPDAVEHVVLKALAKDPRQRFTSMQAFAVALARASQQNAIALLDDATQPLAELKIISPSPIITETTLTQHSLQTARPHRIFLIAAPADESFASRLRADMEARGIVVSCASEDNTAAQQDALRQAVRDARAILVVVSPVTRSSRTIKEQLRIAGMYQQRMVFVRAAGDDLAQVLPEAWGRTAMIDLVDARGTRYTAALDEIMAVLEEERPTVSPEEATLLAPPGEIRNPFKGLHAFNRMDADDFFGRDTLIAELAEAIEEMLTAEKPALPGSRLLTVIGPSGSGKSSVVMAGLLPALQQSALPDSERWVYLHPMLPGEHPLESLALACAPHLPKRSLRSLREDLDDDSARGLHLLAVQLITQPGSKVVLTIDQFEEVFTQASSERERQHFIDLLVTAAMEPSGPLLILLTLRADFYDRPMHYSQLSSLVEAHQKSVLSMNPHELRAVIERPAALPDVQVIFEENLVGDLLFEAQGQIGALPLLEFTLDQLFRLREGHWLTNKAYRQIGGVKGALAKHAESTYASLPTGEHRQLARALFLRLIDPGANEQDTTRRRAALSELSLPDSRQRALMREVADAFVAARLLTTNEVVGITTIEVSHEALIREWARFTEWLREAREDIILQQAISVDAVEWVRRGRPADRLYRGTQLTEVQAWAERNVPSADEVTFLQAGTAEHQRQEGLVIKQKEREAALQRRVITHQRRLISILSVFSVAVIVLASLAGVFAYRSAQDARIADQQAKLASQQAKIALARTLAIEADKALSQNKFDLALLLSNEATQLNESYETRNSLLNSLEQSSQLVTVLRGNTDHSPIQLITFGSTNSGLLVASDRFHIFVWNTKTPAIAPVVLNMPTIPDLANYIGGMALSVNGQQLALSSPLGVWLQDTQTGHHLVQLDGKEDSLPPGNATTSTPLAFSENGQHLLSARCERYTDNLCTSTKISMWDMTTHQLVGQPHSIQANADTAVFNAQRQELATINGPEVQFWQASTGDFLRTISTGSTQTVTGMAFSPDGSNLATISSMDMKLWDVTTGQPLPYQPLAGHTDNITDVAFSPDNSRLAASRDNTVLVWDIHSGYQEMTLTGDPQSKLAVAFSADGVMLATGSLDGTIPLWRPSASSAMSLPIPTNNVLDNAVFSSDGTVVFAGGLDGKVYVIDAKTGRFMGTLSTSTLTPDTSSITSLALGGGKLAAGRYDGTIVLWDVKTHGDLRALLSERPLTHFVSPPHLGKIMLSADGRVLAASGDSIQLWNVTSGTRMPPIPYHKSPSQTAPPLDLSPDGKQLAIGVCAGATSDSCETNQVQFWDITSRKMTGSASLKHAQDKVIANVAFSPDGQTLAVSSSDGITLWNVGQQPPKEGAFLALPADEPVESNNYNTMLFSPDGNRLASYGSSDRPFSFIVWDLAQQEALVPAFNADGFLNSALALSPDGLSLASFGVSASTLNSGIFTLWTISIPSWQKQACSIANRNLTLDEWKQFAKESKSPPQVCSGVAT